jgi:hypothetical protein
MISIRTLFFCRLATTQLQDPNYSQSTAWMPFPYTTVFIGMNAPSGLTLPSCLPIVVAITGLEQVMQAFKVITDISDKALDVDRNHPSSVLKHQWQQPDGVEQWISLRWGWIFSRRRT